MDITGSKNGRVVWITGYSGSGKTTIAKLVSRALSRINCPNYILDGDVLRKGLNIDLGFSEADRHENIRRAGAVAALFSDAGLIFLTAFISPYRSDREVVRNMCGRDNFIEVYLETPLSVCEQRDVKGLYKKARSGEIKNFTGIDSPYEPPITPDLKINTTDIDPNICAAMILKKIGYRNYFDLLKVNVNDFRSEDRALLE